MLGDQKWCRFKSFRQRWELGPQQAYLQWLKRLPAESRAKEQKSCRGAQVLQRPRRGAEYQLLLRPRACKPVLLARTELRG